MPMIAYVEEEELQMVRLEEARLCEDCRTITNSTAECRACGSKAIHPVSAWLEKNHGDQKEGR